MTRPLPEPRTERDAKVLDGIRENGWYCKRVLGGRPLPGETPLGDDPDHDPPFAYTVGLSLRADPELILVGEWEDACRILWVIGVQLMGVAGRRFAPGDLTDEAFERVPARFGAVDEDRRLQLLTSADFVNHGEPFEALQVIIPDADGRWPEDPAYDGTPQPLLGAA